ncbi:hypothetical protein DA075_13495 [Methylobacterium currus]|uniref:Uncharacterized protein n=1 Tax=Methylobacterium currus TaxID=2051553 RepID=A0A2R4WJU4_9HYPH|nr:hypothetical protein DA075_13495 [Methylobacterium currus]
MHPGPYLRGQDAVSFEPPCRGPDDSRHQVRGAGAIHDHRPFPTLAQGEPPNLQGGMEARAIRARAPGGERQASHLFQLHAGALLDQALLRGCRRDRAGRLR